MIDQGCAVALSSMKRRRQRQLYHSLRGKPTARQAAPSQRGFERGLAARNGASFGTHGRGHEW